MALLELDDLCLEIGGTEILKSVNFAIREGEVFGLVGESGSGKSMTALSTMQLLPHAARQTGQILFDGTDLAKLDEKTLCSMRGNDIGMVFQEPMTALNPVKTIGAQVAESLILHGKASRVDARRKAADILSKVGLPSDRFSPDRYPHQLSGGQRQRVVIAIAIACGPRLLIADEPTTALDVTIQAMILKLLKDIVREEKMALLLISHDLAVVAEMADRVAIMKDGEIVEQGPTVPLFRNLRHDYSKRLLEASRHVPAVAMPMEARAAPDTPLLAVDKLECRYPLPKKGFFQQRAYHKAVHKVSFCIDQGQSIGLVGESGCGKSTLARAILGLEQPVAGRVQVDGQSPHHVKGNALTRVREAVQVVFQDPYGSFDPRHKVSRTVAEPLFLERDRITKHEKRDRVAEALVSVGLSPADGEKYPHEFSGGQRQRIAIARALVTRPRLVIADEPVSALDVSIRAQILDLFAQLRAELGLAYLFISHDLSVVRAITDRVLVMNAGEIVEGGATSQVFDHPQHPYTRLLVSSAPDLETTLARRERSDQR